MVPEASLTKTEKEKTQRTMQTNTELTAKQHPFTMSKQTVVFKTTDGA